MSISSSKTVDYTPQMSTELDEHLMYAHGEITEEILRKHEAGAKATEERFLNGDNSDDEGWRSEALAIIEDIRKFVKQISISHHLPCDQNGIYMNLETKEGSRLTIELSSAGFRVCGHQFDTLIKEDTGPAVMAGSEQDQQQHADGQISLNVYYETPYALLDSISIGYRDCFSTELAQRLQALCQ